MQNGIKKALFIVMFSLLSAQVFGHGDLTKRINEKTREISESPKDFRLYYERGLLYQQHIEYTKAQEDYLKSRSLGNTDKALQYRIAEVNYLAGDYNAALKSITSYLEVDGSSDVKAKKLEAQILFELGAYKKSLYAYRYVIDNMRDLRPEDILEYCDIILAENDKNQVAALDAIESGLKLLGPNTLSLQLRKLDLLKNSGQIEKALDQYNYFLLEYDRREFWYYKKAMYLAEINRPKEAIISLKLATGTIDRLDMKFKNMNAILKLKEQIKSLEAQL
ncbi:tetratricopeptide repeat protein [Maribacter sp. ANRC-HE7]|uniref:Tetratricopeptide repeat protein n=1 Tax=Maribacter aquimaris TaxID=2737171 RepID=A0ABR7V1J3_9FLAO|nr:tetratricopeptide repeat protein [Maribacter aquimaris]MBD0777571.1 tetratricopeptide repeat protein [Maribacter aquimaris]